MLNHEDFGKYLEEYKQGIDTKYEDELESNSSTLSNDILTNINTLSKALSSLIDLLIKVFVFGYTVYVIFMGREWNTIAILSLGYCINYIFSMITFFINHCIKK